MLRSILYRSAILRSHYPAIIPRYPPPYTISILAHRSISTANDSQRGADATPSGSTRAPSIGLGTTTTREKTTPDTSHLDGSSHQRPLSSDDTTKGHVTPEGDGDPTKPAERPSPLAAVIDVEEVKERLRSWTEGAALTVRDKADRYTAVAATTFAQLGRELNKVTGYGEIESLKIQVVEQGMVTQTCVLFLAHVFTPRIADKSCTGGGPRIQSCL